MSEAPRLCADEQAGRKSRLGFWQRILIVNAVGALAAFGLIGGLVTRAPWPQRWKALAISFIYANSIGGIAAFVMPLVSRRLSGRSRTTFWAGRLATIPVVIFLGCLVAGVALIAVGMSRPNEYFAYLASSLWISYVVGTVACLTVIGYETMRSQLAATTLALRTKERDEAQARRLATEAQLASLESRVRPHFLFNTLNSIAELIHRDPKGAERMTEQLASLLRSSLDQESERLIPLDDELAVVRDYLDIERVRFGDRLRYAVDVDASLGDLRVPRLSVQTLVENSIKYAVAPRREGGSLAIRAATNNGHVRIEVEDNGPGFDPASMPAGHGLALLRSRLAMTFGDRAALSINSRPGRTSVAIEISNHKDHEEHEGPSS